MVDTGAGAAHHTGIIRRAARDLLDFSHLRPGQKAAIQAVLRGRDTLSVMPTGSGKSAIYQIAGAMLDGPTVVVSPLIALQQDQVTAVAGVDIGGAAQLNSTLSARDRRAVLQRFAARRIDFLFLAPEQLARDDTTEQLGAADVSLFVVDEAHCISDWGHDFRPDFLRLGHAIDALGHPLVLALTATASPPVRREIVERLRMRDPEVVVRGFDRPNIHLAVVRYEDGGEQRAGLIERVVAATPPGIVYVATRRDAERYAAELRGVGLRAGHYHGGMGADEREAAHRAFQGDELEVMVATPAFGMGIDKPNVRFVYHGHVPGSLDAYHQEVGRAGRDGAFASAVLSFRTQDLGLRRYFASSGGADPDDVEKVAAWIGAVDGPIDTDRIAEQADMSDRRLTSVLTLLEDAGTISVSPDGYVRTFRGGVSPGAAKARAVEVKHRREQLERSRLEMMRSYAETDRCRGRFILNYLGEQLDGLCGHCDNCLTGAAPDTPASDAPFPVDARVRHRRWGEGTVVRYEGDRAVVLFDRAGYRTLALAVVNERQLLEIVE